MEDRDSVPLRFSRRDCQNPPFDDQSRTSQGRELASPLALIVTSSLLAHLLRCVLLWRAKCGITLRSLVLRAVWYLPLSRFGVLCQFSSDATMSIFCDSFGCGCKR
ncbi:hypothetical protein NEOLEDRAFT_192321 [Neolentinus lepideus HHB14362 ss-1]|uniref:Uncharacterized protein n=1 Tax=Neolentinus lepideus HHB14362 ss-1 TaxID=1314782 RepID=A0A165MG99_9AGAM|nr:hypothetical protein NEOLEDRAFT_192321 [Neolentinus lepideus HHB14362 ss-1]